VRPDRLVAVLGSGTAAGKTWVSSQLIRCLRERDADLTVAARKPVQSYSPCDPETDADVLAAATGERPTEICPEHRWYAMAMAPPMAALFLGKPSFTLADILDETTWPDGAGVGVLETIGGPRSPVASDADSIDLAAAAAPDVTVLVATAHLGAINAVRLSADCIIDRGLMPVVFLNRFRHEDVDERNLLWLQRDHYDVVVTIDALADRLIATSDA
jgi:dethiobiotin synthetase